MDIQKYSPIPTKRPRRSHRLINKDRGVEKESEKISKLESCPLGYFDLIPIELKCRIFLFLTVEDLSILTITSKSMRNLVEGYRVTRFSGPHHISYKRLHHQLSVEEQANYLTKFYNFGLLMKRSTCLYATKDRLKIMNEFLTRTACCNTDSCKDPCQCIALLCFGKFFHTIIAGWDDTECQRAFQAICQHMSMQKHLKIVVISKPGLNTRLESYIRYFFRSIFLDLCSSVTEKAFWISRILKPWPLVFQARLLFVLYCKHFSAGEIQWNEMSESVPVNSAHLSEFFGSIATILQTLHLHSTEWSSDEIICMIDEMTSTPDDWLVENIAALLMACGNCIATEMLTSKAINGRFVELASIIASFCLICVKYSFSLKQVMTMLENVLEVIDCSKDRLTLLNRIADTFKELILDTHEFTDSDDGSDSEFYHHVTAMTEFVKLLTQLAFKHVLSP